MNIRQMINKVSDKLAEPIRYISMRFVLSPAAFFLPRKWALALADALSLLLCILPKPGRALRLKMKKAFGIKNSEAFRLARGWLALPLRDFVIAKRLIFGREKTGSLKIVEKNIESINKLRKSGASYIVACGHFAREAAMNMHLPIITPGHIYQVTNSLPSHIQRMYDRRIHLQLSTLFKAAYSVRDMTFVFTDSDSSVAATLYANLCKRGNVVLINIDVPYENGSPGTFSRTFAGSKNRTFSPGAIILARLTQCPIISCINWKETDGTLIFEWGEPIKLDYRATKAEDIQIMNKLLDGIEIAIGKRPSQYIFDIYGERCWNPQVEQWQDFD